MDCLGIDLELAGNGGTRPPFGVELNWVLREIRSPDRPTRGYQVALQETSAVVRWIPYASASSTAVAPARYLANQLLDFRHRQMALDLFLANLARSTTGAATGSTTRLDQILDGVPEARIEQIGTITGKSSRSLPVRRGLNSVP